MILKLKSPTLNKEFELEAYQKVENGREISIVAHNTLLKMFTQLQFEHAVIGDPILLRYRDVVVQNNHIVIEAMINYKGFDFLPQAGESSKETLNSTISRDYPYLETQKRAFDRAVIAFLNFPIKMYSDREIPIESFFDLKNGFEMPLPEQPVQKAITLADIKKTIIPFIPSIPQASGILIGNAQLDMLQYIANYIPVGEYDDISGKVQYYLNCNNQCS